MSDKDDPFTDQIEKFQNEISKMISDFYVTGNPLSVFSRREWCPPTDVFETENDIFIKMEIAGMRLENISVVLDEDRITVSGFREDTTKGKRIRFRQMEVKYTRFNRQFLIPSSANGEDVEALYSEGFLTVRIGKRTAPGKKTPPVKIRISIEQE